jgi:putative transposase
MKVERHFIKENQEIINLCSTSKDLYNKCNFLMRNSFFSNQCLPDINVLVNETKNLDCYKNLHNSKTAKQTIRKVISDWSNFKKALNAFYKNPKSFKSKPKPPYYKKKMAQVIFYSETIKRKPLKDNVITPTNECFGIKSEIKNFKQILITPKTFGFIVDIQYEEEKEVKNNKLKEKTDKNKICNIDLGINNLCAITSDQHIPILINGRIVKSFNQWYNKNPSKTKSKKRYFRMENYFHHVSKLIVQNCIENGIGTIIIGKNNNWKQKMNMGKKNNQKFQYIPFSNLQQKIEYKAKSYGINVIYTEESYTSQSSYLDRDPLPQYNKENNPEFSGSRIKRGLYKTKNGILLNADVNGSANIGRKVIQDEEILFRLDRSLAARPIAINPLRKFNTNINIERINS